MKYQTTVPETVQTIYNDHYTKGKGRTVKDIRNIINKLEQVGLLQDKNQRIIRKTRESNQNYSDGDTKEEITSLLIKLEKKGLVTIPFLKAIRQNEGEKTKIIIEATQKNLEKKGITARVDYDSCAAMKNLLAYLQILTNGRGKYQLTSFGKRVFDTFVS
jgi:hypothetical protein